MNASSIKRIAFYGGAIIPIHAGSLDERPLGGTETGVIRIAALLAQRGYDVTVFTSHKNPPPSTPRYLPAGEVFKQGMFDLFILVQDWKPCVFKLPATRVWFWTGDGPEQYSNFGIGDRRVPERIERLLAVSVYHADSLAEHSGFPREKISIVGNGVWLPLFEGSEERARHRLIFTAAPYRGLQLVPAMYAELKKRHPQLELHSFSGMSLYDREQPFQGPQVALYQEVAKVLQKLPGVTLHGNVPQPALAREYMKSAVFFYPCMVPETCCMTALEAQAGGCASVTSTLGALRDTVAHTGLVVDGQPGSEPFLRGFIEAAHRLLSEDELWQACAKNARERALRELAWEHVADRFQGLF